MSAAARTEVTRATAATVDELRAAKQALEEAAAAEKDLQDQIDKLIGKAASRAPLSQDVRLDWVERSETKAEIAKLHQQLRQQQDLTKAAAEVYRQRQIEVRNEAMTRLGPAQRGPSTS